MPSVRTKQVVFFLGAVFALAGPPPKVHAQGFRDVQDPQQQEDEKKKRQPKQQGGDQGGGQQRGQQEDNRGRDDRRQGGGQQGGGGGQDRRRDIGQQGGGPQQGQQEDDRRKRGDDRGRDGGQKQGQDEDRRKRGDDRGQPPGGSQQGQDERKRGEDRRNLGQKPGGPQQGQDEDRRRGEDRRNLGQKPGGPQQGQDEDRRRGEDRRNLGQKPGGPQQGQDEDRKRGEDRRNLGQKPGGPQQGQDEDRKRGEDRRNFGQQPGGPQQGQDEDRKRGEDRRNLGQQPGGPQQGQDEDRKRGEDRRNLGQKPGGPQQGQDEDRKRGEDRRNFGQQPGGPQQGQDEDRKRGEDRRNLGQQPGGPQQGQDDRRRGDDRGRDVGQGRGPDDKRFEAIRPTIAPEDLRRRRQEREVFAREKLQDVVKQRRERRDERGRIVIEEPDKRIILHGDGGRAFIRHDETARFRGEGRDFREERGPGNERLSIVTRAGGVRVVTVVDDNGRLLRRVRRTPDGREFVLIDNRDFHRNRRGGGEFGFVVDLPPPVIRIPRDRYYVYADRASEEEIEDALSAPPVDDVEGGYSLDEIRYSPRLRERMPSVNLNTINFEFGSWEVGQDQVIRLEVIAKAIEHILRRNPDEVFLIEGHTDAVGSDEDNLSLSDRRAESVARVLSDEFNIPPENLVTQGYGEQYLLVSTDGPERNNRRVEFRRITPLLARGDQAQR